MSTSEWPQNLPVTQVRIARPTNRLGEVVRFYTEGIGLKQIGGFQGHQGYDGVMLGLPGTNYHLEFTQHENSNPCHAPTKDNLLVLYIPDHDIVNQVAERLRTMGYPCVKPENPYWRQDGITIEDPDGWRVVLMKRSFV